MLSQHVMKFVKCYYGTNCVHIFQLFVAYAAPPPQYAYQPAPMMYAPPYAPPPQQYYRPQSNHGTRNAVLGNVLHQHSLNAIFHWNFQKY